MAIDPIIKVKIVAIPTANCGRVCCPVIRPQSVPLQASLPVGRPVSDVRAKLGMEAKEKVRTIERIKLARIGRVFLKKFWDIVKFDK